MNKILVFILTFLTPAISIGQEKYIPINFSILNEATAIPFGRFVTMPIHPGVQLGTEFNYKIRRVTRLFQTASLNYFYHANLNQGIGLFTEIGSEYRMKSGLAFTGLFGLGYMHTFAIKDEFAFVNGRYEKKTDKGNARLYPSLSLDLGYYLKQDLNSSPKIFLRYQSWLEYPYSPGFIPVMAHINLHVGAKLFIKRGQK